jgi:hypothetical protein
VESRCPLISHDFGEIRRVALRELAAPYVDELDHVDGAVEVGVNMCSY